MESEKITEKYYVGLDIGTDSVGYAVTDNSYNLKKFKGTDMWGATVFDEAQIATDRRTHRSERRRLDRRQQRVALIRELFSKEINKIDPDFFIRLHKSYVIAESENDTFKLFPTSEQQKEYYKRYPTIHHLIVDLMYNKDPHDVRLVYMACAWLVAHRGHFLSEVSKENVDRVLDFHIVYNNLISFLKQDEYPLPWDECIDENIISNHLKQSIGFTKKLKSLEKLLFGDKKVPKTVDESHKYNTECMLRLICGGKVKLKDLYDNEEYVELGSVSLDMDDDALSQIFLQLGDDSELLIRLKSIYDWSVLVDVLNGENSISKAKVDVYNQHKRDLQFLKYLLKDKKKLYIKVFKDKTQKYNYIMYTQHFDDKEREELKKASGNNKIEVADKENFSTFVLSVVKNITPKEKDLSKYEDMIQRLELRKFLPKQKDGDNRVIPYQLYWSELDKILDNSEKYLYFLNGKDVDGLTVSDKIKSVFEFKVPYYVGPLRTDNSPNAWMVRKSEGKIYPWNFERKVDLDRSEQEFISRMTNTCTYLPSEKVLPKNSICYCAFSVLNEINNIKVNGVGITVKAKQGIYTDLFMNAAKVSVKKIKDYLLSHGYMSIEDELSGLDETVKSTLKPYLQFKRLIESNQITVKQAERIIERATFSEDNVRFRLWIDKEFSNLTEIDRKYISSLKFKDFGRLSKEFLCGIFGTDKQGGTGEAFSIMQMLWDTNCNLMELLSERFTFASQIENIRKEYYLENPQTLNDRLDSMYVSGAVKRPIIRTLDIIHDIVKIEGKSPDKIFVEMARDAGKDQKGKRTKSRYKQLEELYNTIDSEDVRELNRQLDNMGDKVDNMLQSDKLFLYFIQLGKCLYTGAPISLDSLKSGDGKYNIEHIYPQSKIKDDSIINNEILVDSKENGQKSDTYPISPEIQNNMRGYWEYLHKNGLMSDEKYRRLVRTTPFTDEEKMNFINRQLVETRQSTKAVATLLKEKYPDSEIVYVKAGLVSDFRHEFNMIKSRAVNDMHHAKDAYLNIVVGDVYNSRFSKQWFKVNDNYSIKTQTLFNSVVKIGNRVIWKGSDSVAKIQKTMLKTPSHFTKYQFCRKGGLFDAMPLFASEGLICRKKDLPCEKYGGYNKSTASYFVLVKYNIGKKQDIMVMPVDLMYSERFLSDDCFANDYAKATIGSILNKEVDKAEILLNKRILKINTMLSFDGFYACISGKSSGGLKIGLTGMNTFICGKENEEYIKRLESFFNKKQRNENIKVDTKYDGIDATKNEMLYNYYIDKLSKWPFVNRPNNPLKVLKDGKSKFMNLDLSEQVIILLSIQGLFGRAIKADLSKIGGSPSTGVTAKSSIVSNWKKNNKDVRIIDLSASGLFETKSENLLDLL